MWGAGEVFLPKRNCHVLATSNGYDRIQWPLQVLSKEAFCRLQSDLYSPEINDLGVREGNENNEKNVKRRHIYSVYCKLAITLTDVSINLA